MTTGKKKTTGAKKTKSPAKKKKSPVYVSELMKQPVAETPASSVERADNDSAYEFVAQGYRSLSRDLLARLRKDPVGTLQDLQMQAVEFVAKRLPTRKAPVDGKPDYATLRREWLKRRISARLRRKSH
jgi:hypothetical protein